MRTGLTSGRTAAALATAASTMLGTFASVCLALANPVAELEGRWSGWGSIVLASGASEQVKCVATYFVKQNGKTLQQNLRCASAGYNIDAVANLELSGSDVSGKWEERVNAAQGQVSGRVTDQGFSLSIQGDQFSAAMAVTTSACKQSINIAPRGVEITRISIGLGKC